MGTFDKYDGFAEVSEKRTVPFHYEDGTLELFLGGTPCSIKDGTSMFVGQKRGMMTGGYILFHLSIPFENYGIFTTVDAAGIEQKQPITLGNVRQGVDYYIDGFEENSKYTQLRFAFPELNYFIPSAKMHVIHEDSILFIRTPEIIKSFEFTYKEKSVAFKLRLYSTGKSGMKGTAETKSELLLEFAETDDMEFFLDLYYLIHDLFSFLCNRQNISLDNATLSGKSTCKVTRENGGKQEIVEKESPTLQTFVVVNKYKEEPEDEKKISKTIRYDIVSAQVERLFKLFLENKISIFSIHSSFKARNLLDLKQCLHITAAFEYYQRKFLPEISSQTTLQVYEEIKNLIGEYANSQGGEKKKKAIRLLKSLSPVVSLQDKICKVYNGYADWPGLNDILSEYFKEDISELANAANEWRNELAHEKREYEPDKQVISSIRLVEHLNYCIVLRVAGFTDDVIKAIIESVLIR